MSSIPETFDLSVTDLLVMTPKLIVVIVHPSQGAHLLDDAAKGEVLRSQVIGADTLKIHTQQF